MGDKNWFKDASNDGSMLTFGVVGLLALVSAVTAGAARNAGRSQGYFGGANQGSQSQYTDFMATALPEYRADGYSSTDAMRRAAAEWRSSHPGS